ncbi:hypothetical protein CKO_02813 [Citrobacter koseri ATCC BAA-895]|uniref:Uncharacterized protein n=1 Tax=Citrobacter koseri (strain ATCC BAA-895 / CDC 4225-83 / SGSC4696) TaxID=290338 RepID=A8AKA6_CITK8|nr:hypothetical protein CKO_02813 [Citrobacter koseri ATCC BAA-895]
MVSVEMYLALSCRLDQALAPPSGNPCLMALRLSGLPRQQPPANYCDFVTFIP